MGTDGKGRGQRASTEVVEAPTEAPDDGAGPDGKTRLVIALARRPVGHAPTQGESPRLVLALARKPGPRGAKR